MMRKRHVKVAVVVAFLAAAGCLAAGLATGEGVYLYTAAEIALVGVLLLSLHGALKD